MSTHNICFHGEIRKYWDTLISGAMIVNSNSCRLLLLTVIPSRDIVFSITIVCI